MKPRFQTLQLAENESFLVFRRASNDGFSFNWHRHAEIELTLIEQGRGRRFVGDHIGDYEAGDLVLLGSNLPHTWRSETGTGLLSLLSGSEIPRKMEEIGQEGQAFSDVQGKAETRSDHLQAETRTDHVQPSANKDRPSPDCAIVAQFRTDFMGADFLDRAELLELRQLFERASGGLLFSDVQNATELRADMNCLLAASGLERVVVLLDLLRKLAAAPNARVLSSPAYTSNAISELADDRIARVCRFIMEQIDQAEQGEQAPAELSLARVAAESGMAPASFSRFFKRATGRTFISYVNELRIGRACRLLLETDLTITEIAYRVGFNNLSNFNRRFRKIRGEAPRDYRSHWNVQS